MLKILGLGFIIFGIFSRRRSERFADIYARMVEETQATGSFIARNLAPRKVDKEVHAALIRIGGAFLILFGIGLLAGFIHD